MQLPQSLTNAKNLEISLALNEFSIIPLAKRLRFLYEICEAVEYFHSIGILLKSLSSPLVFFKESSAGTGYIRPIIAGLENARLMTESSVEIEYDVRFEAPDFIIQGQRMHTPYTDIWSLAVLVRYCITGGLPLSSPFANSTQSKKEIRQRLGSPNFLCESNQLDKLPNIKKMLKRCFLAQGSLRPPVPEIGRTILDSFTDLAYELHKTVSDVSDEDTRALVQTKAAAKAKIQRVRSSPKKKPEKDDRLSKSDWLILLNASNSEVDAVCEYIVGASAWLDLVEAADCEEQFDPTDNGRAYFYSTPYKNF
ncbi:hypothetical protein BGZ60DRAFT_421033 [Tricladium varicosporioides]|nr:hypothetical protein BGZ60DRAFT_421033 [Hymenoscyphus varicosporioides]